MKEDLKKLSYPTWDGFDEPSPEFVDFCKSMVGKCILMRPISNGDEPESENDSDTCYIKILNCDEATRYFSCLIIKFECGMYKLLMSITQIRRNHLFRPPGYIDIYELPLEQFEDQMKKVMSMCQPVQDEVLQHA